MQNIYKRGRGNDEFTYIMTCWEIMKENIKNRYSELQNIGNALNQFIKIQGILTNSTYGINSVFSYGKVVVTNFTIFLNRTKKATSILPSKNYVTSVGNQINHYHCWK